MSDLGSLFSAQAEVRRWRAESENASARLELARVRESIAFLISQHEPVASSGVDREKLRHLLSFVQHHDVARLGRDLATGE